MGADVYIHMLHVITRSPFHARTSTHTVVMGCVAAAGLARDSYSEYYHTIHTQAEKRRAFFALPDHASLSSGCEERPSGVCFRWHVLRLQLFQLAVFSKMLVQALQ